MNKSNEILDELQGISPFLAAMEKINVFKAPDSYFNGLAERIAAYTFLNQNESELHLPHSDVSGLQRVPEEYFDSLSDQVLAKIKKLETESDDNELQKLSPVLFSLKDKNVFTVPAGYFENASATILSKLNNQPAAKIVSFKKIRTFWKYAAAAVITGAIGVSSLQIFNTSPDMLKNNSVVTESSGLPDYIQSSFQYKTPEQVDQGIATLSDEEIVKYLEKHGNIMDNDNLTNGINTGELPATTDYLTDDNALNDYLNTIDAKSSDIKTP